MFIEAADSIKMDRRENKMHWFNHFCKRKKNGKIDGDLTHGVHIEVSKRNRSDWFWAIFGGIGPVSDSIKLELVNFS